MAIEAKCLSYCYRIITASKCAANSGEAVRNVMMIPVKAWCVQAVVAAVGDITTRGFAINQCRGAMRR